MTLAAYLLLLLQPCAVAMGHEPNRHSDGCQHEASRQDVDACLTQPVADCANDDLVFGGQDTRNLDPDFQAAVLVLPEQPASFAPVTAAKRYFSRGPPTGAVPLNVRHCIYLK